jgi:hypothetical protein
MVALNNACMAGDLNACATAESLSIQAQQARTAAYAAYASSMPPPPPVYNNQLR